jgi:hypothetical protein
MLRALDALDVSLSSSPSQTISPWIHLLRRPIPTGTQAILELCRDTPVERTLDGTWS